MVGVSGLGSTRERWFAASGARSRTIRSRTIKGLFVLLGLFLVCSEIEAQSPLISVQNELFHVDGYTDALPTCSDPGVGYDLTDVVPVSDSVSLDCMASTNSVSSSADRSWIGEELYCEVQQQSIGGPSGGPGTATAAAWLEIEFTPTEAVMLEVVDSNLTATWSCANAILTNLGTGADSSLFNGARVCEDPSYVVPCCNAETSVPSTFTMALEPMIAYRVRLSIDDFEASSGGVVSVLLRFVARRPTLSIASVNTTVGESISLPLTLCYPTSLQLGEVYGWSFGICHDAARLQLDGVVLGAALSTAPDFVAWNLAPSGGAGWTMAAVMDIDGTGPISLGPGCDQELAVASYTVLAGAGDTEVTVCPTLGTPPVENVFAMGPIGVLPMGIPPLTVDGVVHTPVELFVPTDFFTIQAAIDAAFDGDTITVEAGTYVENIDFLGKAITVRSVAGPDVTTIDGSTCSFGGSRCSVVTFASGEADDSVLDGFRVTGGLGTDLSVADSCGYLGLVGAGVYCSQSGPTLQNCRFEDHGMVGSPLAVHGVGLYSSGGEVTLINCDLRNNHAELQGGGGAAVCGGTLVANQCRFENNTTLLDGAGLWIDANGAVSDCSFDGNDSVEGQGGGLYASGSVTLDRCSITGNNARFAGGGVSNVGTLVARNSSFVANTVFETTGPSASGGAISTGAGLTALHCVFRGNAVSAASGTTADWVGGAIAGAGTIVNSILSGNTPDQTDATDVTYSNVEGGHPGVGNIDADPRFVIGSDALEVDSPCVNAGTVAVGGLPALDFEGDPRIVCSVPDMGVDEVLEVAPVIITQPVDVTRCEGSSVQFDVDVFGLGPFDHQWFRDGVEIAGETGATLLLNGITGADAATYQVSVIDGCGNEVVSDSVDLVVDVAISFLSGPVDQTVAPGGVASFSVFVSGSPPIGFQWQQDGTDIIGANAATLSISPVTVADAGTYRCIVTNPCGSATSGEAQLTVPVDQPFVRGDCNADGSIDVTDPVTFLYVFYGVLGTFDDLTCLDACDFNDDAELNVADPVFLLTYLFVPTAPGQSDPPPPPAPFAACGDDTTSGGPGCELFDACP